MNVSPNDFQTRYGAQLDVLDESIYLAEKSGNLSERIALLRERSQLWFQLAKELREAGRDDVAARLSGQSDLWSASRLARGAL